MTYQNKRWNIFARELEDILQAHNLHLEQLDDRVGIHREKVRRLQQSLIKPTSLPILDPQEIELLIETFDLSEGEVIRLKGAMLATAIERMLMNRMDPDKALLASEQIQSALTGLLWEHTDTDGLGEIR